MNSSEFLNEDLTVLLCWESWLVSRTGLVVLSDVLQSLLCILSLSGPWKSFAGWPPSLASHSVLWQLLVCPPPLGPPLFPLLCPLSASQSSTSTKACGSSSHFNVSDTMTVPCLRVSLENRQPALVNSRRGDSGKCEIRSAHTSQADHHHPWTDI